MIVQRILILALLSCILTACGGGGGAGNNIGENPPPTTPPPGGGSPNNPPPTTPPGGDPPTQPPPPPSDEASSAQGAKLRIFQDGEFLTIDWLDLFDNERGYQLERRVGDGEWQAIRTMAAGSGERMEWLPVIATSGTYRLVALLDGYSLPLHAGLNETEFAIDLGPSPMAITLDQTEPLQGATQVSVQNTGPALSVVYLLNNAQVAQATGGGTFTTTLPAARLVNGRHALTALVQKTEGLFIYVNRQVEVNNPNLAALLKVYGPAPLTMAAKASSPAGIVSVAFFVNDTALSVLTAPNQNDQYVVVLDESTLPSGPNVFRAVATDFIGETVSTEQRFNINHLPSLEISGLFDGMIAANGRVDVRATFGDDAPGATLTILVGEQRLVQTQTSPLTGSYSLDGIAPGEYPVLVRVRDATGKVNVRNYQLIVPSTGLGYQLLATDAEKLLAADQGSLLYRKHSGAVVLRTATGTETQLPAASADFERYWLIAGRIVAWGRDQRVYLLDANGQPTDLFPSDPNQIPNPPKVHGPWVSWTRVSSYGFYYRFYNVQTGVLQTAELGRSSIAAVRGYDFDPTPGNERLLLGASMNNVAGIYSHSLSTATTQLLVSGRGSSPQTDGTRMSWVDDTNFNNPSLLVAPVSNPTASTILGMGISYPVLENGLVYWQEGGSVVRVNDGSITTQLSGYPISPPIDARLQDGRILFRDDSGMRVWSAAGGERAWLDTVAREVIQADGVAYFLTGASGTLYRVTLP